MTLSLRRNFVVLLSVIMISFALIPAFLMITVSLRALESQLITRSQAQAETVASLVQETIAKQINDTRNDLVAAKNVSAFVQNSNFVLSSPDPNSRSADAVLKEFGNIMQEDRIGKLFLVQPDGNVALSSDGTTNTGKLPFRLDVSNAIWGLGTLTALNQYSIFVWEPLQNMQQQLQGYLVAELNLQGLLTVIGQQSPSLGRTGQIYLLTDDQKALLADSQPINMTMPAGMSEQGITGTFIDTTNTTVVGSIRNLPLNLKGYLVAQQTQSEALETYQSLVNLAVLLTMAIAALAVISALGIARWITDPLRKLTAASRRIAAGEQRVQVKLQRQDEFGQLGNAFDQMAAANEKAFQSIQSRATQLEGITQLGQTAVATFDRYEILTSLVKGMQQIFDLADVKIYQMDREDKSLVEVANAEEGAFPTPRKLALSVSEAPIMRTYVEKQTVINRIETPSVAEASIREASLPLVFGDRMIGVVYLKARPTTLLTNDALNVFYPLANQMAAILRNAELYEDAVSSRNAADLANQQKGAFLSNMSHELRTPLNVIISYSSSMLTRPAMYDNQVLPSSYMEATTDILDAGKHLLAMINDILDLSKVEAGKLDISLEPVDTFKLLESVRTTAIGLVQHGVALKAVYPTHLPLVMADEVRLRQVLLNLLSNAAKLTTAGSIIVDAHVEGSSLVFSVADTGPGIKPELIDHLFGRFNQDKKISRMFGGTGLGLAISKELCTLMRGKIWVKSQLGAGATFYVSIPLATVTAAVPKQPETIQETTFFESTEALLSHALLFDTLASTRQQLQTILEAQNYSVLAAESENELMELTELFSPKLLVINWHRSDVSADELIAHCQSIAPQTVITVLDDLLTVEENFTFPTMKVETK